MDTRVLRDLMLFRFHAEKSASVLASKKKRDCTSTPALRHFSFGLMTANAHGRGLHNTPYLRTLFVTSIPFPYLLQTDCGQRKVLDILFSAFYAELARLARMRLRRLGTTSGLNESALLHDAYLQMANRTAPHFVNELHFLKYVSRVMHSLTVDDVRNRNAFKRGRSFEITHLSNDVACPSNHASEVSAVHQALDQLAKAQPELAELIDLKFFHGFSLGEIARIQKVSERTLQRKWEKARLCMQSMMLEDRPM